MSHVSSLFRSRRVERRLTTGQLARLLGCGNVTKGSNQITRFEGGGKVAPDLLDMLASELAVTPDEIRLAIGEDYRDWMAWANQPVRPYVALRYLACVYQRIELPDDALEPEAAGLFASSLAVERGFKVCLVLTRRLSLWYDATGREYARTEATPEMPCEPYAVIGGKRVQFDFGGGKVLRQIDEPGP